MTFTLECAACLAGIAAVTTRQPVVAVLYLVLLFSCVSVVMMLMAHGFIGLAYLIVYVGAIAMLFVFVVMLLNVKTVDLFVDTPVRTKVLTAVMTLSLTFTVAAYALISLPEMGPYIGAYTALQPTMPIEASQLQQLADIMFTPSDYAVLVLLLGLLLLVTMVACLTLCL